MEEAEWRETRRKDKKKLFKYWLQGLIFWILFGIFAVCTAKGYAFGVPLAIVSIVCWWVYQLIVVIFLIRPENKRAAEVVKRVRAALPLFADAIKGNALAEAQATSQLAIAEREGKLMKAEGDRYRTFWDKQGGAILIGICMVITICIAWFIIPPV